MVTTSCQNVVNPVCLGRKLAGETQPNPNQINAA